MQPSTSSRCLRALRFVSRQRRRAARQRKKSTTLLVGPTVAVGLRIFAPRTVERAVGICVGIVGLIPLVLAVGPRVGVRTRHLQGASGAGDGLLIECVVDPIRSGGRAGIHGVNGTVLGAAEG